MNDTVIYRTELFCVLAHHGVQKLTVNEDELNWQGEDVLEQSITLGEISEHLTERGYEHTFYVWTEMGLSGAIYMYGNYDPPVWQDHGKTRGYA